MHIVYITYQSQRVLGMKRYVRIKRMLDFIFAAIFLILAFPLMVLIGLAIKINDPNGPILFRQSRPGKHAKIFTIYKFRTMVVDAEKNGKLLSDSERITRVGAFLRKTSIDEWPQLVNILRGEMSFIGPRPLMIQHLNNYTKEQMRRHDVTPGMSGWAQVNGRNRISFEEKFTYDIWYVENISFKVDVKILLRTIRYVATGMHIEHCNQEVRMPFLENHKKQI